MGYISMDARMRAMCKVGLAILAGFAVFGDLVGSICIYVCTINAYT